MKKLRVIIASLLLVFLLNSCVILDNSIIRIENVTWKEAYFQIEATSTQLKNQYDLVTDVTDNNDYYSKMKIEGKDYYCSINLQDKHFDLRLVDFNTEETLYFYGKNPVFIQGDYSRAKEDKKEQYEYDYYFDVKLDYIGQYRDYCKDKDIIFPEYITFYGYTNK